MENEDTNTDYQKLVRVGNKKWDIVEITIGIFFFFFAWDSYSQFYIQGVFKSHLEKITPNLKCQFPPKIPIWPKSLFLHKHSEKWLSTTGYAMGYSSQDILNYATEVFSIYIIEKGMWKLSVLLFHEFFIKKDNLCWHIFPLAHKLFWMKSSWWWGCILLF